MHEENYFCNFLPVRARAHVRSCSSFSQHGLALYENVFPHQIKSAYIEIESGPDEQLFVYMTMSFLQRQLLPKNLDRSSAPAWFKSRGEKIHRGSSFAESWFISSHPA
jgi:hypothetical protein